MKNLKTIFGMAVLAIVAAACNNNDDFLAQQPQLPEEPAVVEQGIPFSATINSGEGSSMRAVAVDGDNISSTFAVDEHVALIYQVGSENVRTNADVTSVDASGNATIEAVLEAGVTDGTAVTLIYPSDAADAATGNILADIITDQDGTLSEDRDIRKGTGTIKVDGTATVDGSITLDAQYAICKFTVKNLANDDLAVTSLRVSDAAGNEITTVTPSPAASVLYVTLPASTGVTLFEATGSDSKKYVTKGTAALTAGKFYTPTMKMATFGNMIGANGKFYADADAATTAGTTAVAKIAYVGSETGEAAPYNHGLALALSNANNGSACQWKTSSTDAGHTKQGSSSFTSESGLQYNATHNTAEYPAFQAAIANNGTAAPTGCSAWFLASGYQWVKMFTAAGGAGNLNTTAGLQSKNYASSSEYDPSYEWSFDSGDGYWINANTKNNGVFVRSCLAF